MFLDRCRRRQPAELNLDFFLCPFLLVQYGPKYGPLLAFGMPATMMLVATIVFWMGGREYAVVPPAGKAWLATCSRRRA